MISLGYLVATASAAAHAQDTGDAEEIAERIGNGNVLTGKIKARSELCQECHGDTGISSSTVSGVPHLAGQYSAYMLKQLRDFKSGERSHPIMNAMAEGLSQSDAADIAAYFASNNVADNKSMQGSGIAENEMAKNLYARGDMKRNVLSCKSCHGASGKGSYSANDIYPAIGGQRKFYLREQLFNWRTGSRRNSPGGVMNIIAKSLSDAEIEALSDYISGM